MPSFDVVSEVDLQEVENAANQARKESQQRYDLKDADPKIEWDKEGALTVEADDDFKVQAVEQILREKLAKRGVSMQSLDPGEIEGSGSRRRRVTKLRQGIDADAAKKITKHLKAVKLKVQAQIQGEQVRVTGKKRDDLQAAIAELKQLESDRPLQFTNFRE